MLVKHNGEIVPDEVRTKTEAGIGIIAIIFLCVIILGCGIKIIYGLLLAEETVSKIIATAAYVAGVIILCILKVWTEYDRYWAKFEIDYKGVWEKYPFRAKKFIPWDHFQEVCICYEMYYRRGMKVYVMICFVKNGAKKNYKGQWKLDGLFSYKKIISLDYTEELHKRLQQICPLGVIDLRDTPEYKLF